MIRAKQISRFHTRDEGLSTGFADQIPLSKGLWSSITKKGAEAPLSIERPTASKHYWSIFSRFLHLRLQVVLNTNSANKTQLLFKPVSMIFFCVF